jgi:hypothetical protein
MSERHLEIIALVNRFAAAFDAKDWPGLRTCLAGEIEVDYADLRGGAPERIAADDYVAARRSAMAELLTLHQLSSQRVETRGGGTVCHSAMVIHRRAREAPDRFFDSYGYYEHRVEGFPDGWRIVGIRQRVLWSEGDPRIHPGVRRAG